MKCLITGFPGMGKSSIAKELKRRGHRAYDPQSIRQHMHVQDRLTGERILPPDDVPKGWYDSVGAFNWDPVRVRTLMNSSEDVFICSLAHNQSWFYSEFDIIFVLTLDNADLTTRLNSRTGKTIGKTNEELSDIINNHRGFEQNLLNKGAIRINVAQPLGKIVDKIIDEMNKLKR